MLASILIFLLVLSVLILVHEMGHFIAARKLGIKVEEFGFGLPPRIFGRKFGETLFSINALPFGGFVRLHGEQDAESAVNGQPIDIRHAFLHKSKKKRAVVIIAGVVMNFLLAIISFAVVYSFSGIPRDTKKLKVIDVAPGSPAQTAGIIVGDVITKIGKNPVNSSEDFTNQVDEQKGKNIVFEIQRTSADQTYAVKPRITPRENPPEGEGPIGITFTTMELFFPPVWQRPFYGIYYGFKDAVYWGGTIASGLWDIIAGAFRGQAPKEVSGPIGIFVVTTEAARSGIITLINFVGILSVNLAILNIVPFPALDGGRLLFIGIEGVIRRKIPAKVEMIANNIGFLLLLVLLLLITVGDIRRLINFGGIQGFINSVGK
jgi:regulator of sigma E protease